MSYHYAINNYRWSRLTEFERRELRNEYRWMRKHGYSRIHTKGTIDRIALLLTDRLIKAP